MNYIHIHNSHTILAVGSESNKNFKDDTNRERHSFVRMQECLKISVRRIYKVDRKVRADSKLGVTKKIWGKIMSK